MTVSRQPGVRRERARALAAGLLAALIMAGTAAARADRDIVFSAQWYRWSGRTSRGPYGGKRERTLAERGVSHLYRVNPDGSRLTRLTSGKTPDRFPAWSPDGRRIAFLRGDPDDNVLRLCLVGEGGGPVRVVARLRQAEWYGANLRWSPDAAWIALNGPSAFVWLVNARTGGLRTFPHAVSFAWSPDGRLLLCFDDSDVRYEGTHRTRLYSPQSGRFLGDTDTVFDPYWLDRDTIIGQMPAASSDAPQSLRVLNGQGKETRRVRVHFAGDDALFQYWGRWLGIPGSGQKAVYEQYWGMSDGSHFRCYLVDTRTGTARRVCEGMGLGVSPDGRYLACADSDWVGPYKRGGRRCGPLRVVPLRTGRARAITGRLVRIEGGDWRKARR